MIGSKVGIAILASCLYAAFSSAQTKPADPLARVDHLVYAVPDVAAAVESLYGRIGIRATAGGQHPGRGTRNALIALGPASYLEIIGPDAAQPKPDRPRWFGIDALSEPRLTTWAAKGSDLGQLVDRAGRQGVTLGTVAPGSRKQPDGMVLSWHYSDPRVVVSDGIVPFFIDWGKTPHPATSAARGASLIDLRAEHPEPEQAQKALTVLGLNLQVRKGPAPALIATLATPRGRIELR
jgi:hypothetical protein